MAQQELQLDQIQGTVLRERPMPYVGAYLLFEIDKTEQARELLRRLLPHTTTAADWQAPSAKEWLNVVFTYDGLRQLGLPQPILDGFPREFRVPMRGRNEFLGDVGESDPRNWDMVADGARFHVGLLLMAPDEASLDAKLAIGDTALNGLDGVRRIARQDIGTPENMREHFGYVDGLSRPFIEGEGGTPKPGQDTIKAGEFLLGYVNELGDLARGPGPEALWRNGTYISIRKLHQNVAAFRRFLLDNARDEAGRELLAAKMIGRWRSGCPLALSPERDDPTIAADPMRRNAFSYYEDDPEGERTPVGCHVRRVNPRDALKDTITEIRLHRLLRRGAAYGPILPAGVNEDDGVSRGLMLAFINADPARQFEFVQSQWVNDGDFISAGRDRDPIAGDHSADSDYRYPAKPIRRHLTGLPSFAVTRGAEHVFLPGIAGLHMLAAGDW
jgi:Dyp-type peroxidase family